MTRKKLLEGEHEITHCSECLYSHIDKGIYTCGVKWRAVPMLLGIPDWCPLPDAPKESVEKPMKESEVDDGSSRKRWGWSCFPFSPVR